MADETVPDAASLTSSDQIGRVRLADDAVADHAPDGSPTGWSAIGVLVAIVVIALMAAALLVILWAALRTTPT